MKVEVVWAGIQEARARGPEYLRAESDRENWSSSRTWWEVQIPRLNEENGKLREGGLPKGAHPVRTAQSKLPGLSQYHRLPPPEPALLPWVSLERTVSVVST
jgi:hypothetical protein